MRSLTCREDRLCAVRADYVTRYAKKEDALPKHSMGDADSDGSNDGSDADEKGFLSSSEDEEDPAAGHLDRCGLWQQPQQFLRSAAALIYIGLSCHLASISFINEACSGARPCQAHQHAMLCDR